MASRSPIQLGAELYGDAGLDSDIEVICLMLETLRSAGICQLTLDLGHVGIYRALVAEAGLSAEQESALFDALQRKAGADITAVIKQSINDPALVKMMLALSELNGDRSLLAAARIELAAAPAAVIEAIDALEQVADSIAARMPDVDMYFDLSELRGYHYHTGLVFAALAPGYGQALANGGRYDRIGEAFGRARAATGFNCDLKALITARPDPAPATANAIFAPAHADLPQHELALWQTAQQLRASGEQVISALSGQSPGPACNRQLVMEEGQWQVKPL
jgi:ATP phosphoribosyltransferase regulatory subunit